MGKVQVNLKAADHRDLKKKVLDEPLKEDGTMLHLYEVLEALTQLYNRSDDMTYESIINAVSYTPPENKAK